METNELLVNINQEDKSVADCVQEVIPHIENVVDRIFDRMKMVDVCSTSAQEQAVGLALLMLLNAHPPFGVEHGLVVGIIVGGDTAIRKAVEFAEDDPNGGWKDLQKFHLKKNDSVIGIAASGATPYVIGAIEKCNANEILTACITCNKGSKLAEIASYPIECVVGPEFVTGSTRMKAGTAQKLILNMISTSLMIKLGKIQGNRMVDMQLSNNKLVERGTLIIMEKTGLEYSLVNQLLIKNGSVRAALEKFNG